MLLLVGAGLGSLEAASADVALFYFEAVNNKRLGGTGWTSCGRGGHGAACWRRWSARFLLEARFEYQRWQLRLALLAAVMMRVGLGDRVALGQRREHTGNTAGAVVDAVHVVGVLLGNEGVSKVVERGRKTEFAAVGGGEQGSRGSRGSLTPPRDQVRGLLVRLGLFLLYGLNGVADGKQAKGVVVGGCGGGDRGILGVGCHDMQ